MAEMTCRDLLPFINDLADGSLKGKEKERVKRHITSCRDCSGELRATKKLKAMLKNFDKPKINGQYFVNAAALIMARIKSSKSSKNTVN